MEEKKEASLETHTIAFMIGTALFFDLLQFLLSFIFMGWLVGLFAGLTFWWWFRQHGVSFKKGSVWGSFALTFLIEVIPILGDLPAWTLEVSYLALSHKAKEVIEKEVTKVPGGKNLTSMAQKTGIM
jgi:hypothetical protein